MPYYSYFFKTIHFYRAMHASYCNSQVRKISMTLVFIQLCTQIIMLVNFGHSNFSFTIKDLINCLYPALLAVSNYFV